jgi:hypothetical protein
MIHKLAPKTFSIHDLLTVFTKGKVRIPRACGGFDLNLASALTFEMLFKSFRQAHEEIRISEITPFEGAQSLHGSCSSSQCWEVTDNKYM